MTKNLGKHPTYSPVWFHSFPLLAQHHMRPQLTPSQDDRERKAQKVIIRTRAELAAPSPPVDLGNQSNNFPLQLNGNANTSYITAYTNESSSGINIPKEKKNEWDILDLKTQIHSHSRLPDESVSVHNTLNEKHQFCCYLCQLGLVEAGPGLELVVSLVASQRVHLQLEKVHLKSPREAGTQWVGSKWF